MVAPTEIIHQINVDLKIFVHNHQKINEICLYILRIICI